MDQNIIDRALQTLKDHIPKVEWSVAKLQTSDTLVFSGTPKANNNITVRFMIEAHKLDDSLLSTATKFVKVLI